MRFGSRFPDFVGEMTRLRLPKRFWNPLVFYYWDSNRYDNDQCWPKPGINVERLKKDIADGRIRRGWGFGPKAIEALQSWLEKL